MINLARKLLGPFLPHSVRVFFWKILLRTGYDARGFLLELLPAGSVGAEVGVWQGDFSARILRTVAPAELHLIDPWIFNSDYPERAYGGVIARRQEDMDGIYEGVVERFAHRPEVIIHRASSASAAARFSDQQLDWIYIDGDHSEDAVFRDLELYLPKIKTGGYITGDDYDWTNESGERAVKKAVARFVAEYPVDMQAVRSSQFVLVKLSEE